MPELPEVEHAKRCLQRWLTGKTILRAEASRTRVFRGGDPCAFARALRGRTLERIDRRGKYLLLSFDGGVGVMSHLGMTGKWVRREEGDRLAHSRARLALDDGSVLHYCDPRLFGRIAVHRGVALSELPEIRALGPDPLADGIDPAALHDALEKSSRAVKVALMDQGVLAGVGNIQATEALFRAGVQPARPARSISREEARALAEAIQASIEHTFLINGPDEIAYLHSGGDVENRFLIYDRAGSPCPRCGRRLEKVSLGGRTSAYCPQCQR